MKSDMRDVKRISW